MRHLPATSGSSQSHWILIAALTTALLAPLPRALATEPVRDADIDSVIWLDANRDGIRDKSEPGIADAQVSLLDCDGHFVAATSSDETGRYRFNVAPGCYRIQFAPLDGYRYCPANLGGDARRDSDADPSTGITGSIDVQSGANVRWVDAGLVAVQGGALGDRVWEDANANGVQDPGETGIAGVQVQLRNCDDTPVMHSSGALRQAQTDANGYFIFEDLAGGCYRLHVDAGDTWRFSTQVQGSSSRDTERSGSTRRVRLDDGARFDLDVGLYRPASVGDWVWFDSNANGIQDRGERGVAGIGVLLLTADGMPTGRQTKTDARGYFEIADVTPGDYRLQYIVPPRYRIGKRQQGIDVHLDSDANSLGTTRVVALRSGGARPDVDLGLLGGEPVAIALEKLTNGFDADEPTGPFVEVGGDVLWEYIVSNTGQADLFQVTLIDDQGVSVNCETDFIAGGDSITCVGQTDDAQAGQYMNTANVCGNDGTDEPVEVCASDVSHYFGSAPGVAIDKLTNGEDADLPNGPNIDVGDPVSWTYVITNTGNVELTDILVSDSEGVEVTCPSTALQPGVSMTCTGNGTAIAGPYMNLGNVSAMPPVGDAVNASDPSHYFGVSPQVSLRKTTNGEDADTAPGPSIGVGEPITWEYVVSNDGNVTLSDITVTDDQGVVVTCPPFNLAPGDTLTCTGTGVAQVGPYMNIGTVCASSSDDNEVCATDPSHYTGVSPMVDLEKLTQNVDADVPQGPNVIVGLAVTWDYVVTNNGGTPLTDIAVTDDDPTLSVVCPGTSLDPGQSFTCSATGTAVAGQYANVGTVTATGNGMAVSDSDPSHYFGVFFDIALEKSTNGMDADVAPGPFIGSGEPVTWTYVATNTGNVRLNTILLSDDRGVDVSCPPTEFLEPGASITCTGEGIAGVGQYANVGTVCGFFEEEEVCDTDPSHYFGAIAGLGIEKATNGVDADTPTGPQITEGQPIAWTYAVTNNGNLGVSGIVVTDDQGVAVTCPATELAAGASMVCTGSGVAVVGQYMNLGSVTGQPVDAGGAAFGDTVTASDPSHYLGLMLPLASIGDSVFVDEDRDGVQDPGEPGLAGVTVNLWVDDDGDGTPDRIIATAVTDANGNYVFPDLDSRLVYFVQFVAPPGQPFTTPNVGDDATDSDADPATGITPAITLTPGMPNDTIDAGVIALVASVDVEKATNGDDADTPSGPTIIVGEPVTWTYVITNTGELPLQDITVSDDQGVTVTCPADTLDPGASLTCSGSGVAVAGQYANVGTVSAQPTDGGVVVGGPVTDSDPSHYFGEQDECVVTSSPRHSIWFRDFNGDGINDRFLFEPDARLTRNDDGTASITGTVRNSLVASEAFLVEISLAGETTTPPPGSPKNQYGADISDWIYYPQWSAVINGIEDYAGATIVFTRVGPAFQIGTGANDTPEDVSIYGGSGWLDFTVQQQADNCLDTGDNCIADSGHGEVMVRIVCPEDRGRVCSADGTGDYALFLPGLTDDGLAVRYDLDGGAQMLVMGDGSAYLTGMARKQGESNYGFAVDLQLEGRTAVAPPGSPHNPHGVATTDWEFYVNWSGTLTGEGWNEGAQLLVERFTPLQVGTGASAVAGEENTLGGTARLGWRLGSQPLDCARHGDCMATKGEGNISLRLVCP